LGINIDKAKKQGADIFPDAFCDEGSFIDYDSLFNR
jgi:hypothetical protein